jgi:hypothetical protein
MERRAKPASVGMPIGEASDLPKGSAMIPAIEILAPNLTKLTLPRVTLWFSYTTPVAIKVGKVCFVSENIWGNTTGKHLHLIEQDAKMSGQDRTNHDTFLQKLENAF